MAALRRRSSSIPRIEVPPVDRGCTGWASEQTAAGLRVLRADDLPSPNAFPAAKQCALRPQDSAVPETCVLDVLWQRLEIGLLVLDVRASRVVRLNRSAQELLEIVDATVDYPSLQTLFLPELGTGSAGAVESNPRVLQRDSTILGYTVYPISPALVVILLRDITERKRLEAIAEAANLMENIGYVFSGIRHELGNPVNNLKMTLSVLHRNLSVFSAETINEYIARANSEVARVEYLLAGLRSFSLYEGVKPQQVHLPRFIDQFLHLIAKDLSVRGITVEVALSPEAHWVLADARALQQVLLNLLTNSLDALTGVSKPQLTIASSSGESLVELLFADNGRGMTARELADALKPFYTTKPEGSGLGLVIAKKMLAAMGGHLELTSEKGFGTQAAVTLPRAEPSELEIDPTSFRAVAP